MDTGKMNIQRVLLLAAVIILAVGGLVSSGLFGLNWNFLAARLHLPLPTTVSSQPSTQQVRVVSEESVVINVVEQVSPSVVTVGINQTSNTGGSFQIDPFDPFAPFRQSTPGTSQKVEQDIGSGFIVGADGLIVTNKHVVSDASSTYKVFTKDNKTYDVTKIYRDPVNDLAILKINAPGLPVVTMGDSGKIQVGQLAIAIGTALGEFRNTVTTGVVSGIGRGITAGDPMAGEAEKLDNVIQTSAAINPGNSGGPLLNSSGQVIGVNSAVSSEGQNIGFALPINVVKDAIANFNQTGQFNRPYLGVQYKTVTQEVGILNDVPQGAYVMNVVAGSPAEKAGLAVDDIIIQIDTTKLTGANSELSTVVGQKKVGDKINIVVYRNGNQKTLRITLGNQADQ